MPNIGGVAAGAVRKVTDTFNRTVTGQLGTASGGSERVWTTLAGTWYVNSTSAQSDTAGSSYARASQLLYPNATMSADVSGGVGFLFWGIDASNWWSAYPNYIQNSSTSSSCTGSLVHCYTSGCTPSGGCGTIYQTTGGGVTTCTGSAVHCYTAACAPGGCGTIYETLGGGVTTCTGSAVHCYTAACAPGGCGTVTEVLGGGETTCTGSTVSCYTDACAPGGCGAVTETITQTCPSGYSGPTYGYNNSGIFGLWCSATTTVNTSIKTCTETYGTGSVNSAEPCTSCYATVNGTYQFIGCCEVGTSGSYQGCKGLNTSVVTTYVGYTDSYVRTQNTNVTSAVTYDRYQSTNVTSPVTYDRYQSTNVTSPVTYDRYQNTTVSTTTYTYDTQIKVVSSVSGTIVTQSTTTLVSASSSLSPVASLKAVTLNDQVTVTAYSGTGLGTQLGSPVVYTATSPNKGGSVGIIKGPSAYSQGSTLDNYSATA